MIFQSKEYLVRLACAPRKWIFFKAPLNLVRKKQTAIESHCQQKQHYHHCHHLDVSKVDLLAILPYFVSFVMEELKVTVEYDHDHHANNNHDHVSHHPYDYHVYDHNSNHPIIIFMTMTIILFCGIIIEKLKVSAPHSVSDWKQNQLVSILPTVAIFKSGIFHLIRP